MEMEETKPRGNTVLLTIIAVATLLVAVIGATFAYFSVTVNQVGDTSSVIVRTGMLGITFTDGNEINFDNIMPGDDRLASMTKNFTIVNTGDYDIPFTISWVVAENDFGRRDGFTPDESDFLYSLVGTGAGITGTNGVTNAPLWNVGGRQGEESTRAIPELTNVTIPANTTRDATQTYTLTFSFENKPTPQDYDQNRSFSAVINVAVAQGFQIGD